MKKLMTLASVLALTAGATLAQDIRVGVSPGEHAEIMEEVAKIAEPMGLNILRGAEPGAGRRRHPGQQLPAPALSGKPDERPWLRTGRSGHHDQHADGAVFRQIHRSRRHPRRIDHRHSERPDQWRSGTSGAATAWPDQAGRGHRAGALRSGHHREQKEKTD
ncbi:unnamed protein product, partial [Ectocarpus sp. 12 AP-2014]